MSDEGALISGRDRLMESLWQDARREADHELQKARMEADRLADESRLLREREMALASERARSEAMPHFSRILNQAHSRARQLVLENRYAFLDSCFDEVMETIGRDPSFRKKARASFPYLVRQALAVLGTREDIEFLLNPDDIKNARLILGEMGLNTDVVADKGISGGAMIRTGDGSMIVDDTIEGRLSALRETPPIDLLKLICPSDDG